MSLIVEDGSVVANAESFAAVAYADTYHANRSNTAWAALGTPDKEADLRKATDYMRQQYRQRWKGFQKTPTQALDWPRVAVFTVEVYAYTNHLPIEYLVPDNVVPLEVQNACAELALKASFGELAPDLKRAVISEEIGPIKKTYDRFSPQQKRYRSVDAMLAPFLMPGSGMSLSLVRG